MGSNVEGVGHSTALLYSFACDASEAQQGAPVAFRLVAGVCGCAGASRKIALEIEQRGRDSVVPILDLGALGCLRLGVAETTTG